MPKMRVLKPGRWAVPGKPWLPQVEAREGAELVVGKDIDVETAEWAHGHGKVEEVLDEDPEAVEVPSEHEVETKPEAAQVETKPKSKRGRRGKAK